MNTEDIIAFIVLAGVAAGFGILAQRQAARLGVPSAAVPLVGAVVIAIAGNL